MMKNVIALILTIVKIGACHRERGYDWSGKKVALFATSGGSGIGKTVKKLEPYVKGAEILDARMMNGAGAKELKAWVEESVLNR